MRNNLGYKGKKKKMNIEADKNDIANNYFYLNLQAMENDFVSLNETLLVAPRKADGSLPNIDFHETQTQELVH